MRVRASQYAAPRLRITPTRPDWATKAVDKVVAQVSKPAVSQGFQPADAADASGHSDFGRAADWKSAIQQIWKPALHLPPPAAAPRSTTLSTALTGRRDSPSRELHNRKKSLDNGPVKPADPIPALRVSWKLS